MKTTIIGSGVYGKAIAKVLLEAGNDIIMWTEKDTREVIVPESIKLTNSFSVACKNRDLIFILTGSKFVPSIFEGIKAHLSDDSIVILGSKGILKDGTILTDLFRKYFPNKHLAVISGPTFAVDIAALEPVGFTIGTETKEDFSKIKKALDTVYLEHSTDIDAVEMSGSLKNAYAIGSGILSGFNYGPSTRCLYITKVLHEMGEIFKRLNLDEYSTLTLAGVGDLILTCTSPNSRNFTFGTILSLEKNSEKEKYLSSNTVEGYENLKVYSKLLKDKNISAPILETVYDIVSSKKQSKELIDLLLEK